MHERLGKDLTAKGVNCIVEWVKRGTLGCFGHAVRMNKDNLVKSLQRQV